ncbi:hypothetical protein BDZ97DRAFT_1193702 [Flammula alnicola]|nr:hypothetical protein BDZ97DRAFT_1193702 [Flammula alnicola]
MIISPRLRTFNNNRANNLTVLTFNCSVASSLSSLFGYLVLSFLPLRRHTNHSLSIITSLALRLQYLHIYLFSLCLSSITIVYRNLLVLLRRACASKPPKEKKPKTK